MAHPDTQGLPASPSPERHEVIAQAQQLASTLSAMDEYNERFTSGHGIGLLISCMIRVNRQADERGEEDVLSPADPRSRVQEALNGVGPQAVQEREAATSAFEFVHEEDLTSIGLGSTIAESMPLSGPGGAICEAQSQVLLGIQDHKAFLAFLESLQPEDLEISNLGSSLSTIFKNLFYQLQTQYNLQDPPPEAFEFFAGLSRIATEAQRLGLPESEQLQGYVSSLNRQCFREHVATERLNLFHKIGSNWGPSTWQRDANAEVLQNQWDQALRILRSLRAKSKPFYDDLERNLRQRLSLLETI